MLGTRFRTLVAGAAVAALTFSMAALTASPASADPSSPDSSLTGLSVSGDDLTSLAPLFDSATHDYQVVDKDTAQTTISTTKSEPNADVALKANGTSYPLTAGSATVPVQRGRNDIAVTVTSNDNTTTTIYRVTLWRLAAPTAQIVNVADAHSTVYGGTRMTVTLANGALPDNCSRSFRVGGGYTPTISSTFDPATGLTKDVVSIPAARNLLPGKADLVLTNGCYLPNDGPYTEAITTAPSVVTYTAGFPITSADIPATVTTGSAIVLHGVDVVSPAQIRYWIEDAQGRLQGVQPGLWSGSDNATVYPGYAWGNDWYKGSGPRTFHAGICAGGKGFNASPQAGGGFGSCTTVFSKVINWVAPVPTDVSFTPSSGPVSGGTVIRMRGRFIESGTEDLSITVGGQDVPKWSTIYAAYEYGDTPLQRLQDQDIIEFLAPASATTGPVSVTVTSDMGATVARGSFTYSAKPTITSITPTSVANSGGSVISLQGSGFGTSGSPTVIVNGTKSPFVTRVSATQLTAVVPLDTGAPGPVDVTVGSPQGGGVSSAASLTLVAPSTVPTITKLTPTSGQVGDPITLTGTAFGASGTAGVSVDGQWAPVTSSSPTSISFEVPATDTAGLKTVLVGATTGAVTKANAFTVVPDAGITTVTPGTVPSYATGNAAKIALDGAGFGTTGKIKVGAAAAVTYTATASGTHIAGVVVPTAVAGALPIIVTPTGATTSLRSSVRLTAPVFTYVGSNPRDDVYGPPDSDSYPGTGGQVLDVPITGGRAMRLEGSGFGTSGTLKLGTTVVTTKTWTDTVITFIAPAHAAGSLAGTVTPLHSTLSASRASAVHYVPAVVGLPTITRIASVVDHSPREANEFDPPNDLSNAFTLTGTNLAGNTPSATRVIISGAENETYTVVPTSVSATSLTFAAPRGFNNSGWKVVRVLTDLGNDSVSHGINYITAGVTIVASPNSGICLRTEATGSNSVTYTPAVVTITNSGTAFGDSGTVTIDGVSIPASYANNQIVIDMADLASDLADPWGGKSIVITPSDTDLPAQSAGFTCAVTPSVATTVNGATDDVIVPAGTTYNLGYNTSGIIGTFTATDPSGYEYVTAADYGFNGFDFNVHAGAPLAAGDYYVRVALSRATYDSERYLAFTPAPVRVTITGTPITITPVSDNGSPIEYKGQLGDGTGTSTHDFHYTSTSMTDAVTAVTWEYRDSACESQDPSQGWNDGLPKDVARSDQNCGGDGTTQSSWDVRVKTFAMTSTGTDRSIYYQATLPYTQITITPRDLTVTAARADRVYDGTDTATLGDLTVTGAIAGDDISLANGSGAATFADASAGVNKPVTLGADLMLDGVAQGNYTLTNPRPTILGTIKKADAVLSLTASPTSVLLSQSTPVEITSTLQDPRDNTIVDGTAAPVDLSSQTTSICTISGTTVTAIAAGTCVIAGTDASSTNYNAATAVTDSGSTTETVEIKVFPAPQAISVVADDITMATGDNLDPTSQVSGLFDGDSVDGIAYDYYSGSTLLTDPPTLPGKYKVVPKAGNLTAVHPEMYSNPDAFTYVSGTLVITPLPPTITTFSPASGPTTGGTSVTITGTRLDTVKSVRIGGVTLRAGDFTVNQAGTSLTFISPKVANPGPVDLILVAGTASAADVFTYTEPTEAVPGAPIHLNAVGRDQKIDLTFTPPTNTGGGMTAYQVSTDGGKTWHALTTKAGPNGTQTATVTGVKNGVTYSVKVRAVGSGGAGPASSADSALPNAPALGNVKPTKASEVPVPKHPKAYHGKKKYTKARNTSHNGTWAHSINKLGSRQLTIGESATLSNSGLFGFDSAVLTKVGRAEVKTLAHHLRLAHGVSCEGYTDYAGKAGHEKTLSAQRAEAVCQALVHYGAHVTFTKHGYGGARPVVIGGSPESRAENRRVVVTVTK